MQDQTRRTLEQQTRGEEELAAPPGTLMYEGQRYQVPTTLEALAPAIYVAINTNQWSQLPGFIERYRQLAGHRPALVAMAESLFARFKNDYPLALQRMEQPTTWNRTMPASCWSWHGYGLKTTRIRARKKPLIGHWPQGYRHRRRGWYSNTGKHWISVPNGMAALPLASAITTTSTRPMGIILA